MPLLANWAGPDDFATLFQYFWHRDCAIDPLSTGARRSDWTIHIGAVVRNIVDLMGVVARLLFFTNINYDAIPGVFFWHSR